MIFTATLAAALLSQASAKQFTFCKDDSCKDCPVNIEEAGTGYPNCVVYDSKRTFNNQNFPTLPSGGYQPYLSIEPQDPGCAIIVRSPANTDLVDCGFPIGSFKHPTCVQLPIHETFMVQFCCGHDNCNDAGAGKRSAKFSPNYKGLRSAGSSGGVYLKDANGDMIQPVTIGHPTEVNPHSGLVAARDVAKREDGRCNGDWDGTEIYTKPSPKVQILATGISQSATDTKTTSQAWTNGTDFSLSVADIFSLGATFSQSFTETITSTSQQSITVPNGQTGDWGFTAILECSKGHGTCDGKKVEGEICWPKKDDRGNLAGVNHLIVH